MRLFSNVADLQVVGKGQLECRSVQKGELTCYIPLEAQDDRIGYIVVQFDDEQPEAMLLGFADVVETEEFPLNQLRSLTEFPAYLNQIRPSVQLYQWLEGIFETGWQAVETLLDRPKLHLAPAFRDREVIQRAKPVDLGSQSVVLRVAIAPAEDETVKIRVRVYPIWEEDCLPANLKLTLLSESGETLQEAVSCSIDNFIQLPSFTCNSGEEFSIQLALDNAEITDNFVI